MSSTLVKSARSARQLSSLTCDFEQTAGVNYNTEYTLTLPCNSFHDLPSRHLSQTELYPNMSVPTKYNDKLQFMLAGLTKAHNPIRAGYGNAGVATKAGEELWVTYYEAADKKDEVKGRVYAYVIREDDIQQASLQALDMSTLSSAILAEARTATLKQNPKITPKTFTTYGRTVWSRKGYELLKANVATARVKGIDPTLKRQHGSNKLKIPSKAQMRPNSMNISELDAEKLLKQFRSKGLFDTQKYEYLRAAIKEARHTKEQPPRSILEAAKSWAEDVGTDPLKYALYREWELKQGGGRRKEKKEKRRKRYDKRLKEEGFTESLTLPDWIDILTDLVEVLQYQLAEDEDEAAQKQS